MANKRNVKSAIKGLQRVKTWQLIVLLVFAAFLTATFLRLNNIGMVERRAAVMSADEAGDTEVLTSRLYDLQQYVTRHMNTDLGQGVYLEESYRRDSQAALDAASSDSNPNGNIYQLAQEVCAPRFSTYSTAYLECTTSELAKYPAASELVDAVALPPVNTYLHSFVSPVWSPDFAGFSLLVCVILVLVIIVRIISLAVLRALLNYHYRSV